MARFSTFGIVLILGCQGSLLTDDGVGAGPDRQIGLMDGSGSDGGAASSDTVGPDGSGSDALASDAPCTPTTCEATGANCGSLPDGCGATLSCGNCASGQTCGASGPPNLCGVPTACPPAPADATAAQVRALSASNEIRMAIGASCLTMVSEINQAAQAHADYGAMNSGNGACQSRGHDETEGCPGFTGTSFSARLGASGYGRGTSEVAHFIGDPESAVRGWTDTLWHRVPFVNPNSRDFGSGTAAGWDVIDFGGRGAADPTRIYIYPADGGMAPARGGNESPPPPDPPDSCPAEGRNPWGTFVTVAFEESATHEITSHVLMGPGGTVDHRWLEPAEARSLGDNVYAMVPCPLTSGQTYTLMLEGNLGGAPFTRSSSFTTY